MQDRDIFILKEVIIPFEIEQLLTPVKDSNSLSNTDIPELRDELDFRYGCLDHNILRKGLLDYLENYLGGLVVRIEDLKKFNKNLRKQYSEKSENSSSIQKELILNKHLLVYLKEQDVFLRNWIGFKRKKMKNNKEEKIIVNKKIKPLTVKWKGGKSEIVALIKSLIEVGVLDTSLTEKEVVKRFEQFFDTDINDYEQTKSQFRNRTKESTPFINKLQHALDLWIKKRD